MERTKRTTELLELIEALERDSERVLDMALELGGGEPKRPADAPILAAMSQQIEAAADTRAACWGLIWEEGTNHDWCVCTSEVATAYFETFDPSYLDKRTGHGWMCRGCLGLVQTG